MDTNGIIVSLLSSAAAGLFVAAELAEDEEALQKKRSRRGKNWRQSKKPWGFTKNCIPDLRLGAAPKDYKDFLGMDEFCFNSILSAIQPHIEKKDTFMRNAIPSAEKLATTLRFLAKGENFVELAQHSKLSKSFLSEAVVEVCDAIYHNMKTDFLKFPTQNEEWMSIAEDFNTNCQFPLCLGALGAKHISCMPSKKVAHLYYNSKGATSIVLLALADAHGRFIFTDVGCNGRLSDADVLQRSDFIQIIQEPDKHLPPRACIGNDRVLPYAFLADNAFPLMENLMTPYPDTSTDESKEVYNSRLKQAKQTVDRAFHILTNRFQVLRKTMKINEFKVKAIVQCCCVLHNFLISNSPSYAESLQGGNSLPEVVASSNPDDRESLVFNSKQCEAVRQSWTEYFNNEGKL